MLLALVSCPSSCLDKKKFETVKVNIEDKYEIIPRI